MAREKFEDRKLTGAIKVACKFENNGVTTTKHWVTTKELAVARIISVVTEFQADGYRLSLRQLHYQFVKNNWIVNHVSAYKKLGSILDDCRYAGRIDWDAIEDRGRVPYLPYWADNVSSALEGLSKYYRLDRQKGQPYHTELWTEKDALSGILKRSTTKYHIKLVVNKGYTSSSAIYEAYERVVDAMHRGQKVCILYFGDHDSSGLDMVRDIRERLMNFLTKGSQFTNTTDRHAKVMTWFQGQDDGLRDLIMDGYLSSEDVTRIANRETDDDELWERFEDAIRHYYIAENNLFEVRAIGLTMAQIDTYNLPSNPAKTTDTRSAKYIEQFGHESWEVDALNPRTLTEIVETNIETLLDVEQFNAMMELEQEHLDRLAKLVIREAKKK